MALSKNKNTFGLDVNDRLKNQIQKNLLGDTDTDTHTYTDTYTHTPPPKEIKKKRTNGLVKLSVFEKVSAYAAAHNTSFNAIVCDLLDEFIEREGL